MEIIDQSDPNIWTFQINNVDTSICNSLRRIMIGQVPTLCINTVCIKENDSSLFDEYIAHRIGLIPLRKVKDYETGTGTEPGTEIELKIKLEEVGPKRIYSRDIIFPPGIEPVSQDIIILNLGQDEEIKLFGVIEEGIGKDHSKFSPVSPVSYKKIDDNLFEFHIETLGSYTAKEVWIKAIEILKEEIIHYKKLL